MAEPRIFCTSMRRRAAPNSIVRRSSAMTPWQMLCSCRSVGPPVRSSSRSTVQSPAGEVLLEREDLAPVAQRVLREQPHLGEAIEDDALRLHRLHLVEDCAAWSRQARPPPDGAASARWSSDGAPLGRGELEQVDAVERPAVARRDGAQLLLGLRERDVEPGARRAWRPSSRNCSASVVLPAPGAPSTR